MGRFQYIALEVAACAAAGTSITAGAYYALAVALGVQ